MNIFNICIRDLSSPLSAVLRKAREIVKMGQGFGAWEIPNKMIAKEKYFYI